MPPRNTLRNTHVTPTQRAQQALTPLKGGGYEGVASGGRRKEENRLLLKEWFAQKREIADVAGMEHVSSVLRRIVDGDSA